MAGHEAKVIAEFIRERQFDLLVIGHTGHSSIYDHLRGGTSQDLARLAPCSELALVLRRREGIAIEKSADQMDEVQYSSERDLAISNVNRETVLSRGQLWNLLGVRNGDQPQTPRGCAMGANLYQVPGGRGPGPSGGIGPS